MTEEPFLTRPLSTCLDGVRYLSALLVLVGHSVQLWLYTGPFPFTPRLQHNCVTVFFVLSGLVIASSLERGKRTLAEFAIARAARLVPVALAAILFGTAAWLLGQWLGAPEIHGSHNGTVNAAAFVAPMLFLSEAPGLYGPVWNPPYWSLCYEAWFYALFGMAVFLRGRTRIAALLIGALLAGPNVLLLLPVWLMGAAVASCKALRPTSLTTGAILIAACLMGIELISHVDLIWLGWLGPKVPWSLSNSEWVLSDTLLGLAMAAGFAGLRPLAEHMAAPLARIEKPVRWLAGSAFTLYLFHWPLLAVLRLLGVTRLESPLAYVAVLAGIVLATLAIAEVTERRTPAVRRWLEARLLTPRLSKAQPA